MSNPIYTEEMYQALCRSIAEGVYEIQYEGKRIVYRSLDEMMRIKDNMERVLGYKTRPQHKYPTVSKGIE